VRLLHGRRGVDAVFDDPNLVSCAGLVPLMRLAENVDLAGLVDQRVGIGASTGAHAGGKAATIVAGMAVGADSINDVDLLRHGGMRALFDDVYAPSTLGSFLRSFSWGHVRQLEAAGRGLLARLAACTPLLPGVEQYAFIDVDSLLRRVYGKAKQGAGFGHAKVGGYQVRLLGLSPLVATISTPTAAPVIAATRLRGGSAASARGAAPLVREAIHTARQVGANGTILLRGDSAFYSHTVIAACRQADVRFSITVQSNPSIQAAIAGIDEQAWTPVKYPGAIFDHDTGQWISEAQVAETAYTAFASRDPVTARLVVRRIPEKNPAPPGQAELFPTWRYHAFLTDTQLSTTDADLTHRGHAIIELVFADLIDGPLTHLPSGRFAANAAWLTLTAMAHNLTRAAGVLTGTTYGKARAATIRRRIINIPARIAHHARKIVLHLPGHWPWHTAWQHLFTTTHAPPQPT
jgi:Transposase DDE domain group 1